MIDTCGLPMKFEFRVHGVGRTYIVDFEIPDHRDRPLLYGIGDKGGNHSWTAQEIARNIKENVWVITDILKDTKCIDVEDLI